MTVTTIRRRVAPSLLAALAAGLLSAGEASADRLVYSCAPEICAVDPATGLSAPITSDGGSAGAYRWPTVTRDGATVAAARGNDLLAGPYGSNPAERRAGWRDMNDAAIAPDGSAVAESHSYVENQYGCPLTGGCLMLVDRSATFFTAGTGETAIERRFKGGGGVGFSGDRSLLTSFYTRGDDRHNICQVPDPLVADPPCEVRVSSTDTLSSPVGSPDGRLIAVTVSRPDPAPPTVELHDAATGAHIRQLAADGAAATFSPDGRQVAYGGGDGWIHVVPTAGGRSRRVVRGSHPSWGGGSGPGPAVTSSALRLRRGAIPVAVRCEGSAPCRGTVRIAKGRTTLGSAAYRIAAGRGATVAVRPSRRGAALIARARRHAVTVRLALPGGKMVTSRMTLRR